MKRIGLICGGFSSEYDISIKSALTIQEHFPAHLACIRIEINRDNWQQELLKAKDMDAALIYTHGDPGENGKIQAYLDMLGIPYVNSGMLASALSFDKWYCNQFLKGFGFSVAKSALNQEYGQYLPSLDKEAITLTNIGEKYKVIVDAMLRQAVVKGLQETIAHLS